MEERKHSTAPDTAQSCRCCGWGAFVVGLVVALILGWWVLPGLMKVEKRQPVAFNHVLHVQDQGINCEQCHFLRSDGSFSGLPSTASCAECHFQVLGSDPEEALFVRDYVQTGREIQGEWLVYQKQPDNVLFSHAPHLRDLGTAASTAEVCSRCHLDVSATTTPPVYTENRLSGYSQNTMLMWECEKCHAETRLRDPDSHASNACFVCHK